MKIKSTGQMVRQFASTFKEWHYFVGGAAITAVVAAYGYYRLARRLAR